jgi:hypothetical protein
MVGVLALYQMGSAVLVGQHELSRDGKAGMVAGARLAALPAMHRCAVARQCGVDASVAHGKHAG